MNPDCLAGKHPACNGDGWDYKMDGPVACRCACHTPNARVVTAAPTKAPPRHLFLLFMQWLMGSAFVVAVVCAPLAFMAGAIAPAVIITVNAVTMALYFYTFKTERATAFINDRVRESRDSRS